MTTIARTHVAFLLPHARALSSGGWKLDCAASGVSDEASLQGAYSECFELPLSRRLRDFGAIWRAVDRLRRLLSARRYSVIHLHTPIAAFAGRLAVATLPRAQRPTVIYTVHGFHFTPELARSVASRVYYLGECTVSRLTDIFITINQDDYEAARRLARGKAVVLKTPGVGLDVEEFASQIDTARRMAPPSEIDELRQRNAQVFLGVGELSRGKRYHEAIGALARASAHLGRPIGLIVLGEGPERDNLRQIADVHPEVVLRLPGHVTDVSQYMAHSDGFVHPSEREGLPRAVLEAMAAGLPVCAYNIRGIRDLLGDASVLPELGDIDGLAQLAIDCLEMSKTAPLTELRKRAELFDIEAATAATREAYELAADVA